MNTAATNFTAALFEPTLRAVDPNTKITGQFILRIKFQGYCYTVRPLDGGLLVHGLVHHSNRGRILKDQDPKRLLASLLRHQQRDAERVAARKATNDAALACWELQRTATNALGLIADDFGVAFVAEPEATIESSLKGTTTRFKISLPDLTPTQAAEVVALLRKFGAHNVETDE